MSEEKGLWQEMIAVQKVEPILHENNKLKYENAELMQDNMELNELLIQQQHDLARMRGEIDALQKANEEAKAKTNKQAELEYRIEQLQEVELYNRNEAEFFRRMCDILLRRIFPNSVREEY